MDKVKHEINAALTWLEEDNVERAKLHLGFALAHLGDEEAQQGVQADVLPCGHPVSSWKLGGCGEGCIECANAATSR